MTTQQSRFSGKISTTGLLTWTFTPAQLAALCLTSADNQRFVSAQGGLYAASGTVTPSNAGFNADSTVSVSVGGPRACIYNSFTSYWPMLRKFNEQFWGVDYLVVAPNETIYVASYVQGYNPPQNDPNRPAIISGQFRITKYQ